MEKNNMKNMIILKDLPSNIIDEAFIVFKDNIKIHKIEKALNRKSTKVEDTNSKEYIVKEAENVICDYIEKVEEKQSETWHESKKIKEKYKKLKFLTVFFAIFSALSTVVILFN